METSARSKSNHGRPHRYDRDRHRLADARWRAGLSQCYSTLARVVISSPQRRISKIQILRKTKRHIETLESTLRDLVHLKAERNGYHERTTLPRGFSFQDYMNDFSSTETFSLCQNFSLSPTTGTMGLYRSVLEKENRLHSVGQIELPPTETLEFSDCPVRRILYEATAMDAERELQTTCYPFDLQEVTRLEDEEENSFGARVVPRQLGPVLNTPSTSRDTPKARVGNPPGKASRRKGYPRILGRTVRRRLLDRDEENHQFENYVPNLETLVERKEDQAQALPDSNNFVLCSPFTRLLPAQEHRLEEQESFYGGEESGFSREDAMFTSGGSSLEQNWIHEPCASSPSPKTKPSVRPLHIVWLNREVVVSTNNCKRTAQDEEDQTVPVVSSELGTPYGTTLQEVNMEAGFPSPPLLGDFDLGEGFNLSAYMNWCENFERKDKQTPDYHTLWEGFHQ